MATGQFDYIKVSLYGQFDNETRTEFRFPLEDNTLNPKLMIFNPVKVLEQFHNARECYALWSTPEGICYGLVTRNAFDPTSGAMLLSILVSNGIILSGRQVVAALGSLRKTVIEEGERSDEAVVRALTSANLPEHPIVIPELSNAAKLGDNTTEMPKGTGYRTYVSGSELDTILSFPLQEEYLKFRRILIIPATASLRAGSKLSRLTTPVTRSYLFVCPAGITATPPKADEGQRVTLTFTKNGFTPNREIVTAGIPSPYLRYDGSVIKVKTPGESGMAFTRRVRINVRSAKGGMINGYTINVNGRPVNTMEPFLEFNEHDLSSGRKIQIHVASNNFRPLKMEIDPSSLAGKEVIDLELQPLEQGIILRLDFGEGRIFEQEISIEKNTPEYSQLHSGNFHGFRAYRLSSQNAGEIYNVDVRSASKPTAPTFTNVSTANHSTGSSGRQIPVFENLTGNKSATRTAPVAPTVTVDTADKAADKAESDTPDEIKEEKVVNNIYSDENEKKKSGNKLGIIIGVALSIALLILAVVFFLPGINDGDETGADTPAVTATTTDAGQPDAQSTTTDAPADAAATPAAPATPSADENADIAYLNANSVWELSALKSDKYRALFSAIQTGNIEDLVNNEYFSTKGRATNEKAIKIADLAWEAIGSYSFKPNVKALTKAVENDRLDLNKLYEQQMRCRPANPNKEPRPQH